VTALAGELGLAPSEREKMLLRLAERCRPFAQGALKNWGRKVFGLSGQEFDNWLKYETKQLATHSAWHLLEDNCPDRYSNEAAGESDRLLREKFTCTHSLNTWRWRTEPLDHCLMRLLVGAEFTPHPDARKRLAYRAASQVNSARKSMLAWMVYDPDDRFLEVVYLARCWDCGNEASLNNQCNCNGKGLSPELASPTMIFSPTSARTKFNPLTRAPIELYRCTQCRASRSKRALALAAKPPLSNGRVREFRLLFFPQGSSRRCPHGHLLASKPTVVSVRPIDIVAANTAPVIHKETSNEESTLSSIITRAAQGGTEGTWQNISGHEDDTGNPGLMGLFAGTAELTAETRDTAARILSKYSEFSSKFARLTSRKAIDQLIASLEQLLHHLVDGSNSLETLPQVYADLDQLKETNRQQARVFLERWQEFVRSINK
jgi:hypothetical protein